MMEQQEDSKYWAEMEKIKRDPYNYIIDYYEKLYPHMGGKVFSILSLLPCSLIVPPLTDKNGKRTMPRLSYLLLSPPGSAKTSISTHFKKITYEPFPFESITDAKLNSVLIHKEKASLIVSDIKRIFEKADLIKELENVIGDEGKLSRFTKSTGNEEHPIEAIAYLSGTPENLNGALKDGMVFRLYPQIIFHSESEHEAILNGVNNEIGRDVDEGQVMKEQIIIDYYRKLWDIQMINNPVHEKRIDGYIIDDKFRTKVSQILIPKFSLPFKETNFEFIRELIRFYRIMVSFAFLNVFNREVKNGKLVITQEDYEVALKLAISEIDTKVTILKALNEISEQNFRNVQDLKYHALKKKQLAEKGKDKAYTQAEYKTIETLMKYN